MRTVSIITIITVIITAVREHIIILIHQVWEEQNIHLVRQMDQHRQCIIILLTMDMPHTDSIITMVDEVLILIMRYGS